MRPRAHNSPSLPGKAPSRPQHTSRAMSTNAFHDIAQIESSLWEAADPLRSNSNRNSSEYCLPVLGVIFLRHASNRYQAALSAFQADQATGKMARRPLDRADFIKRRPLMLPQAARYDTILNVICSRKCAANWLLRRLAVALSIKPVSPSWRYNSLISYWGGRCMPTSTRQT